MPRTLEYKELTLPSGQSPIEALNNESAHGWRLVTMRSASGGIDTYLLSRERKGE